MLDASAAVSQLLPSQATAASDAFFDRPDWRFQVPYVFSWEVRNLLLSRRAKLGAALYDQAVSLFSALDVVSEPAIDLVQLPEMAELAARHGVSLFDASYLVLSIDTEAPIASRHGLLLEAARSYNLPVHDLR